MGAAIRKKKQMALYFEKDQYERLLELKRTKHINIAAWIRELVDRGLKKMETRKRTV